ncbi:MAG: hypothetical protein PVI65_03630, partial [Desulfobacterales bacterium]
DCAGFGFVYKAHTAAHIEIRVGGCNAVDGPKDKQGVELFFAGALRHLSSYFGNNARRFLTSTVD